MNDILNSGLGSPEKLKVNAFAGNNETARFASAASIEKARKLDEEIAEHNRAVDAYIVLRQEAASGKLTKSAVEVAEELSKRAKCLPDVLVRLIQRKQDLFEALFPEYQGFNREYVAALRAAEKIAEAKAVEVLPDPKHAWTRREIVACLTEKERADALWRPLLFEGTGVALDLELKDARTLLARALTGR